MELCQTQVIPAGSDVGICFDDWVMEMRALWVTLFGGGEVFSLTTHPAWLILDQPVGEWLVGSGRNFHDQQFTINVYHSVGVDWLAMFNAGKIDGDILANVTAHQVQLVVADVELSTTLGSLFAKIFLLSFLPAGGGPTESLLALQKILTVEERNALFSQGTLAGLCACPECACANWGLPALTQSNQDQFCTYFCNRLATAQQQLQDAEDERNECVAWEAAIGIGGAAGVGFITGGWGLIIGGGGFLAAAMKGVKDCIDDHTQKVQNITASAQQDVTNECRFLCLQQQAQNP